ncbi:MTAP family purine nucleoside phosphorylase [Coriobacteriia bacterium Es71-Z0120]|uniref:MTAP family purine nucleoside phosphorylase n=1 Tax=Parvivirga hydrogeniphila TaxID=2939460 RepID=UPI002260DD3B|nr:MTAP family purine nucleoside phosphorylase [Parvivirga hydrogeniphila]MCL4079431.1 MTAP family purine nucleoside phosphorylase [Parvivirga hydrogeniphila]
MSATAVPSAQFGVCGGSGSLSLEFPGALDDPRVEVLAEGLVFDTPFGRSPAFTHFRVTGEHGPRDALAVRMHGWRRGVKRADASLQVFWVFHEAGVRKVLADGGVGALNYLLDPRDVVVPTDFIDLSIKQDIYVRGDHLLIMRQPICPDLHARLYAAASERFARVFRRGVYLVTDGPRFESVAEVDYMKRLGADVIGQSLAPEVFLARDIGACYAGLYIVVNHAEGVVKEWEHDELKAIFFDESEAIASCVLDVIADAPLDAACGCMDLRKPSLLLRAEEPST